MMLLNSDAKNNEKVALNLLNVKTKNEQDELLITAHNLTWERVWNKFLLLTNANSRIKEQWNIRTMALIRAMAQGAIELRIKYKIPNVREEK